MEIQLSDGQSISCFVERAYDSLLSLLGTKRFEEGFLSTVHSMVNDVDRIYCFEQQVQGHSPILYSSWVPTKNSSALIDRYRLLYHRVDPIRLALPKIRQESCAAITFHSDEIQNDEYRSSCFEQFSIRHRLSVVKHMDGRWLTLSVARRSSAFTPHEVDALAGLGRLALPMIVKNQELQIKTAGGNFSVTEMERRLEALGVGFTARERQVCARTLVGMSAEGAAIDLGISLGTTLTYRQRAYRRVNVSNVMQLAALVMH